MNLPTPMRMHLAIFLSLVSGGIALAQERPAPPEMPRPELRLVGPVGTIETRLKQLDETVGLSAEQQKQIQGVLERNDRAMKAALTVFRADPTKENRKKLSALMKAQDIEINAILTEEQKTKGQAAQNAIPRAKDFSPGSTGPGVTQLTPGKPIGQPARSPIAPQPITPN